MWYWIGVVFLVWGVLSLVFNEFAMRVRRVWPWRRDDEDPVRDAGLNEFYRLWVYLTAVIAIEIGAWLTEMAWPTGWLRAVIYAGFGAWLLWRRPTLRSRAYWRGFLNVIGKRPA